MMPYIIHMLLEVTFYRSYLRFSRLIVTSNNEDSIFVEESIVWPSSS